MSATCPSARCETGSLLLGIRGADGRIDYLTPPLPVTDEFVESVHVAGRDPGRTLRFAAPCTETGCGKWDAGNARCRVAEMVVEAGPPPAVPDRLPACGIRSTCRWHAQHGAAICLRCPFVTRTPAADQLDRTTIGDELP